MLHCSACIRTCIPTVFPDLLKISRPLRITNHILLSQSTKPASWLRPAYATGAAPAQEHSDYNAGATNVLPGRYLGQSNRPTMPQSPYKKTSLEQEMRWLKDPLKLADHIVSLLRQDEFQKALAIVQRASKDMECTVSWNHLVDYEMSKGHVTNAVKLYNDMKKRAQQPDAHTFTTLFRGFAWNPKSSLSLPKALSIYTSMNADNCLVKPSIIHTNAVLKVCAVSGDIDALLGVAAKLPPRGNGAPNNLTFTTILNAIRNQAWEDTKGEKVSASKNERHAQAVLQGRRLWEEIRDRWTKGDIFLDEELVCSMGRLLLLGNHEQDCDDIFSLLEQTIGLRRQIPRVGDPARKDALRSGASLDAAEQPILSDLDLQVLNTSEDEPTLDSDPFAPLPRTPSKQLSIAPGCNTLSLTLDACIRLSLVRAAQRYWGLLTSHSGSYNIVPDSENYHMYLRLLRVQRASKQTVELVDKMRRGILPSKVALQTKTFRIALSCCLRDKKNRSALHHAEKLVIMMTDSLEYPDAKALSMYLTLALSQQPRDWRVLMGVIRSTEPGARNLRSLLAWDPFDTTRGRWKQSEEDVVALVRTLIGAFDVVLDIGNEELRQEEKAKCREQRQAYAAWITKMHMRIRTKEMKKASGEDEAGEEQRALPAAVRGVGSGREVEEEEDMEEGNEDADEAGAAGEPSFRIQSLTSRSLDLHTGTDHSVWKQQIRQKKREKRREKEKVARGRRMSGEGEGE